MSKRRCLLIIAGVVVGIVFLGNVGVVVTQTTPGVQSQINDQLDWAARSAQAGRAVDPREAIASIISAAITLLGSVFLVLLIMSGYWLVTARGQEEKEEKAQKTIRSAVVGLAIVLMAYAITLFVTARISQTAAPTARPIGCGVTGASWFRTECR